MMRGCGGGGWGVWGVWRHSEFSTRGFLAGNGVDSSGAVPRPPTTGDRGSGGTGKEGERASLEARICRRSSGQRHSPFLTTPHRSADGSRDSGPLDGRHSGQACQVRESSANARGMTEEGNLEE